MSHVPPSASGPLGEATAAAAGSGMRYARSDHQHPRLTSMTMGQITTGSTTTVTFTRTFAAAPGVFFTEIGGATGATAQPAMFKVESWVMSGGNYTGCVVRGWRAQSVPQNLVTLLLTAVFNIFGASVATLDFACIAVARSDV